MLLLTLLLNTIYISLQRSFHKNMNHNLFGTDGIRNVVGTSPFTLHDMPRLGHAIAFWAEQTYGKNAHILLAADTRISGEWIAHALKTGVLLSSITIHDAGIIPTPAVLSLMQKNTQFDCGIIISASHNPFGDNGIKIVDRINGKLTLVHERAISNFFHNPPACSYESFGSATAYQNAYEAYRNSLTSLFKPQLLSGKKIVLDCAHGATSRVAPEVFATLGAEVIALNNEPTGRNINDHCGSVYPQQLQKAVILYHADAGFAFDGDGDRLTAVGPDGALRNGDDILALLIDHPLYRNEQQVVGTIVSNQGLDLFLQKRQKKLIRVAVGDKYIVDHLQKNNLVLGGEQSGHIIMRDYLLSGDGIFTALRVMEAIIYTGNSMMNTFKRYPQILINLPISQKKDLQEPVIASIIAQHEAQLDSGRLVVRYSGTENVLRIMVEDEHETTAQAVSTQLACALEKELR